MLADRLSYLEQMAREQERQLAGVTQLSAWVARDAEIGDLSGLRPIRRSQERRVAATLPTLRRRQFASPAGSLAREQNT